jgi:hypothetical protein
LYPTSRGAAAPAGDESAELRLLMKSLRSSDGHVAAGAMPPPSGSSHAARAPASHEGAVSGREEAALGKLVSEGAEFWSPMMGDQGRSGGGAGVPGSGDGANEGVRREAPGAGGLEMSESDELRMLVDSLKSQGRP